MTSSSIKYSIVAEFAEAYSFRILLDYLKTNIEQAEFVFTNRGIFLKRADKKGQLINEIIINIRELVRYELNENEGFTIGVDLTLFKDNLSDIGKKDSMRWSLVQGEDSFIIQMLGHSGSYDTNGRKVKIKKVESEEYSLDEYKRQLDDPNFVTPLSDFTKKCKPISSDCNFIILHQYNRGLKMEKIGAGSVGDQYYIFGIIDENTFVNPNGLKMTIKGESETKIIDQLKISSSLIKNLSKLSNVSTGTNIRFFFEADRPVRISCNIGCYGTLINHMVGISEEN